MIEYDTGSKNWEKRRAKECVRERERKEKVRLFLVRRTEAPLSIMNLFAYKLPFVYMRMCGVLARARVSCVCVFVYKSE